VALATAVSSLQIEFTVTDAAGNDSAANFGVDVLANAAPTISAILDQSILMNADTGALAFTVGDTEDGPAALVLAATSSNQVLVVDGTDFLFGGSGASRTLTVTPQANGVGVAVITVTVTDSVNATTTVTFTLTVTDTVSAPSISAIADFTMVRDTTSDAVAFTADDPQGAATITAITFDSSDTALIPVAGIVLTGTAPSLQFTVTPTPGATGTATITVSATDGTFTASRTFVITVQAPGSSSGSGDSDDDDESCTTGESSGLGLLALLALLGFAAIGVRTRKA
jgi:MYXO-CTERM domain-containing protein